MRFALSRKLNIFLGKKVKLGRVPSLRIIRAVNLTLSPVSLFFRRQLARRILDAGPPALRIPREGGYRFVQPDEVPELGPAIAKARQIYETAARGQDLSDYTAGKYKKDYLVNVLQGDAASAHDELMKLALARPIIDAATDYLGNIPFLGMVSVMVSPPNESQVGSQLYHLDFSDEHQLKFFVYLDDVDIDNGPFTFVPRDVTKKLIARTGYDRGRLTPEEVDAILGDDGQIRVTGPEGTAFLVDTSSCMHYGSNGNKATRVVLLIQYARPAAPGTVPLAWPVEEVAARLNLDEVQAAALQP